MRHLDSVHPYAAMAVDVAGDVAVTAFARQEGSMLCQDTHVLVSRDGSWQLLGGDSGGAAVNLLQDRPAVLPEHRGTVDPVMVIGRIGSTLDSGGGAGRWPWSGRRIGHGEVRVPGRVESVLIAGRRLPVPWHGLLVFAWTGRRPPHLVALDEHGLAIGEARPQPGPASLGRRPRSWPPWRGWFWPGPRNGIARGTAVFGPPGFDEPQRLAASLRACPGLRAWAVSRGVLLDDTPHSLRLLDELLEAPDAGPGIAAHLDDQIGCYLGTVIVQHVPQARWRVWPNGHPVVALASGRDLDVLALAGRVGQDAGPTLTAIYNSVR